MTFTDNYTDIKVLYTANTSQSFGLQTADSLLAIVQVIHAFNNGAEPWAATAASPELHLLVPIQSVVPAECEDHMVRQDHEELEEG